MPDLLGPGRSSVAAVLFTDLVESTALMARIGDAPFEALRREHLARLAAAVERQGGTVVKNTGDGIMAVLLVLDDLQWAAKPTVLLLRHVLRAPESSRLLVVATYRDSDLGRGNPLMELLADLTALDTAVTLGLRTIDARGRALLGAISSNG